MKKLSAQKYSILGPGEVWINGQPVKYEISEFTNNTGLGDKGYDGVFTIPFKIGKDIFIIDEIRLFPAKNASYYIGIGDSVDPTSDWDILNSVFDTFNYRPPTYSNHFYARELFRTISSAIGLDAIKRVAKQNNINDTSDDIDDYVITDGIIESGPGFDLIGPNYDSKASTCKECGYENPYIDYDSNYVCRQCKQMVDWAKSASKITRLAGLYFKKTAAKEKRKASGFLLICPKTKELFLVKRAQNVDSPGTWCTVGGGVEKGEDFMQAAKRECVEELGSCPEISDIIDDIDSSMVEDLVYKTFVGVVSPEMRENWKPKLNPENDEFGWFKPNELPKPLHPGLAYTLKILKEKYAK